MVAITDDVTPAEIDECLGHINAEAKACHPSPRWDALHQAIDALLDKRETCHG